MSALESGSRAVAAPIGPPEGVPPEPGLVGPRAEWMAGSPGPAAGPSERIRLLKFITLFGAGAGGTERHFVTLARALDHSRFDLHVACIRRWGQFLGDMEATGAPITEYNINCLYNHKAIFAQLKFAAYLRRHRVQIVHTYGFYPNVFAVPAARLVDAPVIIASIRDTGDMCTAKQRRVQRMICALADCVLVNADGVKRRLVADGYRAEKIRVIRNGIDLSRFENGRTTRLRQEFGIPAGAPLVGVLSRLNRLKGVEYFLEAAAVVAQKFPDAYFLVAGDDPCNENGAYKAELEGYAQQLGLARRIVFTGLRLDVPELLSELAVSVLPSLSEGLSNVLLESMAAGAPVVATSVGGTPEAVEEGVTGLLVPPRDSAALSRAISHLLGNPELAAGLGRAARQRVAARFSLQTMTEETERLYASLIESRAARRPAAGTVGRSRRSAPTIPAVAAAMDARIAATDLHVETVSDYQSFLELEPVWNALVEQAGIDHPFVRHEWIRTWWDCFGAGRKLHVLVVKAGGEPVAIAPLTLRQAGVRGLRLRWLESMYNDHTPRFEFIVARRPREAYRAIWSALLEQRERWDALQVCQLTADSPTLEQFQRLAAEDGLLTGLWPSVQSPYVRLRGGWEKYFESLDSKHRSNLRNRLKRLSRLGPLDMEVVSSGDRLAGALEDGFRLEAAAWKGKAGTAIGCRPELRLFYTSFAAKAAQCGWLRLHFLTLGGRRIAFQYSIRYGQKLYLLKPGYDPEYAAYSPGNLLCNMVLRGAFESGVTEHDFLGSADKWKLDWTRDTSPHYWLFLFQKNLRTRALHGSKFWLLPMLKREPLYPELCASLRGRTGEGTCPPVHAAFDAPQGPISLS